MKIQEFVTEKEVDDFDYQHDQWKETAELTFEEFEALPESERKEKIEAEYQRYADDDQTFEMWYYANIKWVNEQLNKI